MSDMDDLRQDAKDDRRHAAMDAMGDIDDVLPDDLDPEPEMDSKLYFPDLEDVRCPTCGFINGCNCDPHAVGPDE